MCVFICMTITPKECMFTGSWVGTPMGISKPWHSFSYKSRYRKEQRTEASSVCPVVCICWLHSNTSIHQFFVNIQTSSLWLLFNCWLDMCYLWSLVTAGIIKGRRKDRTPLVAYVTMMNLWVFLIPLSLRKAQQVGTHEKNWEIKILYFI